MRNPEHEGRLVDSFHERTVGDLTIRIDRLLCVGFGDCIEVAPEAFAFDGEGIVTFLVTIEQVDRDRIVRACDICPVDALSVFDGEGNQLV
jgi:ferredoxin